MTMRTLLLIVVVGIGPASVTPPAFAQPPRKQIIEELAANLEPTRTVVYKTVAGRDLHLHLFEPAGHTPTDMRASFVFIHGGGWTGGEPRRMYTYCDHFAKLGLLCASVEYRLLKKPKGTTPHDCVRDGRSAIRYLKKHASELGLDPAKIVVAGGSAGGHVAAGTALFDGTDNDGDDLKVSPTPAGLVLFYPVIDTSPAGYGNAKCGTDWKQISPVDQVRAGLPPTLVFHGTGDTVTPFAGAKAFDERMREAGNRSELVVHDGGIHGYFLYERALYDDAIQRTEAFMRSLKLLA